MALLEELQTFQWASWGGVSPTWGGLPLLLAVAPRLGASVETAA